MSASHEPVPAIASLVITVDWCPTDGTPPGAPVFEFITHADRFDRGEVEELVESLTRLRAIADHVAGQHAAAAIEVVA